MIRRKSQKGIKRGPYRKYRANFARHVADIFCDRMEELGLYPALITDNNKGKITAPTLRRVLNGAGGTNINTLAIVADLLDMEIIIRPRPKQKDTEDEDNG